MPAALTNQVRLANAITALAGAVSTMTPPSNPPVRPIVLDPFTGGYLFDLSTRSGSAAYELLSKPLDDPWDSTVDTFPVFIIALRLRASKGKWNAIRPNDTTPVPSNILTIKGHHILTDYHYVSTSDIKSAYTNRRDDRAIQNASALFKCLESSVTGDLKATIFTQSGNLPGNEDGISLFKLLTSLTNVASLQLSMISFNNIIMFDPAIYKFSIPSINSKLINLFMLVTTNTRALLDAEKIQHTINVYNKIKQPEVWAQWVRNEVDNFEEGKILICQDFMNSALVKYNRIIGEHGSTFHGSSTTVQQDIVAMLARTVSTTMRPRTSRVTATTARKSRKETVSNSSRTLPPFAKFFKAPISDGSVEYKVGDTKDWNGTTWYYCDAPTYRDRIKWHTHPTTECRTRKLWLDTDDGATANIAPVMTPTAESSETTAQVTPSDMALLASALNLVGDNDTVKDLIAEALNESASL